MTNTTTPTGAAAKIPATEARQELERQRLQ